MSVIKYLPLSINECRNPKLDASTLPQLPRFWFCSPSWTLAWPLSGASRQPATLPWHSGPTNQAAENPRGTQVFIQKQLLVKSVTYTFQDYFNKSKQPNLTKPNLMVPPPTNRPMRSRNLNPWPGEKSLCKARPGAREKPQSGGGVWRLVAPTGAAAK